MNRKQNVHLQNTPKKKEEKNIIYNILDLSVSHSLSLSDQYLQLFFYSFIVFKQSKITIIEERCEEEV